MKTVMIGRACVCFGVIALGALTLRPQPEPIPPPPVSWLRDIPGVGECATLDCLTPWRAKAVALRLTSPSWADYADWRLDHDKREIDDHALQNAAEAHARYVAAMIALYRKAHNGQMPDLTPHGDCPPTCTHH